MVKKDIDWTMIELCVKAGCKQKDICNRYYIDEVTLRRHVIDRYGVEWKEFVRALLSEGDMLIEAKQFDKAMKGYWPALHWLGKVRLGQREPELAQEAANQPQIDQTHRIMELEHKIAELEGEK